MRFKKIPFFLCAVLIPGLAAGAPVRSHQQVVRDVAAMVSDAEARSMVSAKGLSILNVLWEDTGRYKGSSVGPNISDVTIEVQSEDERGKLQTSLMPVIRFPNFHDKTADLKLSHFLIRVGNQRGGTLRTIPLGELLRHPARYMSLPQNGSIRGGSLLAPRDSHVLVSAQAAFLPIRKMGQTRFWPVIFNYQSYSKNPAVLTLLVTRQGTSMTIIDNARDTVTGGGSWGQRLYYNANGQRAPLTAERLSTVTDRGFTANGESADSVGEGSNLLMLIQVPLKVKPRHRGGWFGASGADGEAAPMASGPKLAVRRGGSDVEQAVLGHGPTEGPYNELDGLTIERDGRFPIRVTVQFYQATSNGVLSQSNVSAFARQINRVYKRGDYVGSLVVPGSSGRPTEWNGASPPPPGMSWWDFPGLVERCHVQGKPCPPRWGIMTPESAK